MFDFLFIPKLQRKSGVSNSIRPSAGNNGNNMSSNMQPTYHHSLTSDLGQSSMINEPQYKKENSATEMEWHNVAQVLSTLRSQSLHATPAFPSRYAKQTTDTDVWAWKQTTDWENRKTIQKYLDKIDFNKVAALNNSFAARSRTRARAAAENESSNQRPTSAPMRRRSKSTKGQAGRQCNVQGSRTAKARPQTAARMRSSGRRSSSGSGSSKNRPLLSPSALAAPSSSTTRAASRKKIPQTAGEWVVGLAHGKATRAPGKKYRISRKSTRNFANVNHKDALTLEKVAFSTRLRRDRDRRATVEFGRSNGLLW